MTSIAWDYLPSSLLAAVFALVDDARISLAAAVALGTGEMTESPATTSSGTLAPPIDDRIGDGSC